MNSILKILILIFITFFSNEGFAGNWCKAIYTKEITEGDFQKQISKCRNSDNFFFSYPYII